MRRLRAFVPLLLAVSLAHPLAGCGNQVRAQDAQRNAANPPARTPTPPRAAQNAPPAQSGRARVRYALGTHVSRAELREGRTLLVDFGVPGEAKYSMGGWMTSTGDDAQLDGASVLVMPNQSAKLALPIDTAGAQELTLRVRALRRDRVRVYFDEREIGGADLAANVYTVVHVTIPAERGTVGEHLLQLRTSGTGNATGIRRAGLLVDWLRLAPEGATATENAPPSPEQLEVQDGEAKALAIPGGLTVGYALEVLPAARLRGTVKGSGALEVIAVRDGRAPETLGRVQGTAAGAALDVDLGGLAATVVRLDLKATGDVRVVRPEVVTLDAPEQAAAALRRPRNVVVYLIDTLRADALRPINPDSRVETPGLARFVEHAAVMARAHTQENWTKPSVATLMSSLFPWQHNAVTTEAVVPAAVTLAPEIFEGHGYYTGAFIANGYVSDRFGFRQGWSTYRNYIREGRRSPAQYVAADVLEWLDHRPTDQPFFLYVHTIDPHVPYRPPASFLQMYDPNEYSGVVDFRSDNELLEKIKAGQIPLNARDKVHLRALYDGEISYHDVHFNSILEGLERRGVADDTMVVVTADHGEEFWDHGSVGHGHSVYEELLHIPMFVKLPGAPDVQRIDEPVGLVDVLPTVLDAMGLEIPSECSGHSFLPLLLRQDDAAPHVAISGFMDGWRAANVGQMKLIHRTIERVMLYDLRTDPSEQHDLAPERPVAVRYLRGMLGLALGAADGVDAPRAPGARPARPVVHQQETTTIDAQTEAELRALGYVGGARR